MIVVFEIWPEQARGLLGPALGPALGPRIVSGTISRIF